MQNEARLEERSEPYENTESTHHRVSNKVLRHSVRQSLALPGFSNAACMFWSQKVDGPISTLRLNALPHLHLAPINQIVFLGALLCLAPLATAIHILQFSILNYLSFYIDQM
ncbi:hypothetical protein A3F65_02035 [Candidatus Saccharibacteria bacterium RIFCSPHIGHO2_12_FULL_47_16b]|nr:MAG: hypothetical protein A3F65_02035 [Candidatus Saccharibacteria bacterium RIFCSPHIGHO2_12_FULL_47_16b]